MFTFTKLGSKWEMNSCDLAVSDVCSMPSSVTSSSPSRFTASEAIFDAEGAWNLA